MFAQGFNPKDIGPMPTSGSALMDILSDENFIRRLVGQDTDCVSALRQLNLSDEFWLYEFKVVPCAKSYSHKWTLCPCAHAGETARRRCPRQFTYKAVLCPLVKAKKTCPLGDACTYAHNVFEHWLHPSRYKTRLCSFGRNCNRPICFFAHSADELRCVSNAEDKAELDEREYLMQLMLANDSGLLNPNSSMQLPVHAAALTDAMHGLPPTHSAPVSQASAAAAVNLARGLGMQPRANPNDMLMAGLQGLAAANGSNGGVNPQIAAFEAQQQQQQRNAALTMERMSSMPHSLDHSAPLGAALGRPPMRQMSRSMSGQTSIPGFDTPLVGAGAARNLLAGHHGSVNSVQSEPIMNPALALQHDSHHLLLDDYAGPIGRLSDPGTSNWGSVGMSAFANSVNPVPHMNRISDSGNTLGMISAAGLDSLLPLVNSALASGQLQIPGGNSSAGRRISRSGAASSNKLGSPGSPARSCSPPSPPSIMTSGIAEEGASGVSVRSDSPEPASGSTAGRTGSPLLAANGNGAEGFGLGDGAAAVASPGLAAKAAAAMAAANAASGNVQVNQAQLNTLMQHLQEQGLAANKEQLVASLSQLLAQLLSVS